VPAFGTENGLQGRTAYGRHFFKERGLNLYRKEITGSGVLFLLFAGAFWMTLDMNAKCRTYPQMVTCAGMALCAVCIARAIFRSKREIPVEVPGPMTAEQIVLAVLSLAAAFVYILVIRILGYVITTFLFIAAFSFFISRTIRSYSSPWVYFAVAAGSTLVLYLVFGRFLNVPLPKGLLI